MSLRAVSQGTSGGGAVDSVNGQTGVVVLDIDDIGGVFVDGVTITGDGTSGDPLVAVTGGGGTVSTVSIVTANGFAGTVANATTTPAITLSTSVTGLLKGDGTSISAASAGTDYVTASSTNTFTNKTFDADGTGNSITNIENADIKAGAAIAVNKLAALTADRAVITDGSGFLSAATTTATEIGYVNGVTSSIQTQLNGKQATITPAALTKADDTNVTLTLGGSPSTALLAAASITAGWTGVLSGTRGGTGVNNGSSTITLGGNLTTSGAFTTTLTVTGNTNVTLPTTGTLATLAGAEALTNKSVNGVTLTTGGSATNFLNEQGNYVAGGGGSGDVVGPASSTDNAIVRFDGLTGKSIQNYTSGAPTIGDTGATAFANTVTITSNSATAFTVGPNGSSNPCLTVAANTASADNGVTITGGTAGVTLLTTGNDTNSAMTIGSKGSGAMTVQSGTNGNVILAPSGLTSYTGNSYQHIFATPTAQSTATNIRFGYTGAADTNLTAGTEAPAVYFNIGQTRTHASNTAITLQRDFRVTGSTHAFASSGGTITDCAAFSVDGPDSGGTNATLTNSHGIYLPTRAVSNVTNAYGLTVAAPSGATNNFAMRITGTSTVDGEIRIDGTPTTDHTANGPTTNTFNAGTTVTVIDLLYLASDGEWALADADAASTSAGMLAIALAGGTDGNPLLVATAGSYVRDDTWNWTPGAILYVDTTAGAITATAPSATGDIVRVVGYAMTADVIYFMPSGAWVEVP